MPGSSVSPRASVEQHLAAAVEYIAIAESADAKIVAYEHAADEIIVAQRDDPTLSFREIGVHVGKSKDWVHKLVQWRTSVDGRRHLPFADGPAGRDRNAVGARKIARERPEDFAAAYESAPPDARREIAERLSRDPDVRTEVHKRHAERQEQSRPAPVPERSDHSLYAFESRLVTARRALREALALSNGVESPGDDDDILELIEMLRQLVDAVGSSYRSGQSLDSWAQELYERSADS